MTNMPRYCVLEVEDCANCGGEGSITLSGNWGPRECTGCKGSGERQTLVPLEKALAQLAPDHVPGQWHTDPPLPPNPRGGPIE